jgi:hypothetical protein
MVTCRIQYSVLGVRCSVFSGVMKAFWRILDLIVGAVFIYAGMLKAIDPVRFAHDIDNYKILPWMFSAALAFYLPWLEILCGGALVLRFLYRGGLSILSALILVFIGATIAAKARGLDITCGCFGHASQHWSFPQHLAVDLAIFAALSALLSMELIGRTRYDSKATDTAR